MKSNVKYSDILAMSMESLYEWYSEDFIMEIPDIKDLTTQADLISHMLTHLANSFVYFDCMASMFESVVRQNKYVKAETDTKKNDVKLLINKRDALIHFADQMKFCYNALSRQCTVKIESSRELNMLNKA